MTLAIIHRECTLIIKSLFYIKCSRMCVWYFCFSLLVLGTYCSGGGTEETSDEDRNGDGNGSIWWTAVALFTLRGTLLQMFRSKAGKGWRRTRAEGCEWLEVWWFVTRPPFGFWWVAHVGCVRQQDGHIVGHDGETPGPLTWTQTLDGLRLWKKKTIDSGNYSLHMWLSDADYVLMRKNDSLLTFTHFHMHC